jgi:hypothetical protein
MPWISKLLLLAFLFRFGGDLLPDSLQLREIRRHLANIPSDFCGEIYSGWVTFHRDFYLATRRLESSGQRTLLSLSRLDLLRTQNGAGDLCRSIAIAKRADAQSGQ